MGWWEVCYRDTRGWVEKRFLQIPSVAPSSPSSAYMPQYPSTPTNKRPFMGQTRSNVNLREGPGTQYAILRQLAAQSNVYVFSTPPKNGFYKVIYMPSGQLGWLSTEYVVYQEALPYEPSGAFQKTSLVYGSQSEITVQNSSSYLITLVVGENVYLLSPYQTQTLVIAPGTYEYVASAPTVIPASGQQTFESGSGYTWNFYIRTQLI
ncbi:MAG: SH3 domain-containing protein [Microscillaceae bacterium]|nr:SH3 domain-containing protein [Microscillaceae bacterium]